MIRRVAPLLVALLAAVPAAADTVILTSGRKVTGGVCRNDADVVAVNPYHSRHPGMVFDVTTYPREKVKEVVLEDPPFREYLARSAKLAPDDVAGRLELARWCEERKLDEEREIELLAVLRADPENEAARKELGDSRYRKLARGNPDLDAEVRAAIDAYLGIGDPEEREKAYGRLERERSVDLPRRYLDRIIRSRAEPKGLTTDRPLTLRCADHPGVYTIFVPKDYDARRPWPLVLGLHGGGVGGKEHDAVVGNGRSAMNFYVRQAAARGYIVVCPTARAAPWAATPNEDFLLAVLEEVELLYHVDLNRVYLTGHSMGGFGAWHYGPLWAERFAAISPMAGGGGGGIGRLEQTGTPIFIYHGADDGVVPPGSDRAAARSLAKTKHDFIYTELSGVGHGFPESIQRDLFDFFDTRRLAVVRGRRARPPTAEVRSSFLEKVSRDEKRFLGDPLEYGAEAEGGKTEWKRLVKDLKLGGGKAEAAATRLGEIRDEKSVKPISDLLRNPGVENEVKVHAARALGLIGHEDGYRGLAVGLRSEHPGVFTESARAMAAIRAPKSGEALLASLDHLVAVVEGKRIGENRIYYSDWERWLAGFAAVVEGLGELAPEGASAAIHRTAVAKVVLGGWDVISSKRAGQDPERPRRALAKACRTALEAVADSDPAAAPALKALRAAGY